MIMKCKIVDLISYRNRQVQAINLYELKNHQLCLLASLIADELLIIDKQLLNSQKNSNKIMLNANCFKNNKLSLIKVIEKINEHVFNKKRHGLEVNLEEFHDIFNLIKSNLEKLLLFGKKDTLEFKKLYTLYQALNPIYNQNKALLDDLNSNN